jgi:hypothetical protein
VFAFLNIPVTVHNLHGRRDSSKYSYVQTAGEFIFTSNIKKKVFGSRNTRQASKQLNKPRTQATRSRDISVGIARWATGWMIGVLGFVFRGGGLGISLFTTASITALGPTQPPVQWIPGALSLGVKRPGREAYHPPPSSAEVKE